MHHGQLRPLDTRLSLSSIFSSLSLRPWGARNSRHSWYAIQSWNLRKFVSKEELWKEKKYWLGGKTTTRNNKKTVLVQKNFFSNDKIRNKLKIFLIFPYFDLSTVLIMISFPHTLFPVGLWHCIIHDFSFLSFRSLLSFHTLDSWRSTAATWPFITFIFFYSHHSGCTIFTKWLWISFFSSYSRHPSRYLYTKLSLSSLRNN